MWFTAKVADVVTVSDKMQFPHERLTVYQKALDFFERIQRYLSSWSQQHALLVRVGQMTARKEYPDP
jgi:hypothetical protein